MVNFLIKIYFEKFLGVFEEVGLQDPTFNFDQCIDSTTAQEALTLLNQIISDLETFQLTQVATDITNFVNNVSPVVLTCLATNVDQIEATLLPLAAAYGLTTINPDTFPQQAETWALTHLSVVIGGVSKIAADVSAQQYDQAGKDLGSLVQTVVNGANNTTL